MAVLFYDEGDHPAGFVGFRVATTLGLATELKQTYYSLSDYSYSKAYLLAHKQNNEWREQAEINKRVARLEGPSAKASAGSIIKGLRAGFRVERGRKAHYGTYITPGFFVQNLGYGNGDKLFRITMLGFDKAYRDAVLYYASIHKLSAEEMLNLEARRPDESLFTNELLAELVLKGYLVIKSEIQEKMSMAS
jgi:hypothetical protein